eukprot:EG_transcript_9623
MATNDQYNSYLKSGQDFSSWYKAKAKELDSMQKPSASGVHLPRHRSVDSHLLDGPTKEAAPRKPGALLDTLMLGDYKPPVLQGALRPRNLAPVPSAHVQASLAQAQASLAQLPPLHNSRRSDAPAPRETGAKAEAKEVKDTPEMEQALNESRTRRQARQTAAPAAEARPLPPVREPLKAAPAAPTPSSTQSQPHSPGAALWQRRQSPSVSPLEEIRKQKESEAAQEEVLLRRARG